MFRWGNRAQLFAGDAAIARPDPSARQAFTHIAARPTSGALQALGRAITGTTGFCVSEQSLPAGLSSDAGCFLTLTGGSSGQPKIIQRSQSSWIKSFHINAARFLLAPDDSVAVVGNLSHSLALYGVLEALHLGLDAYALDELPSGKQRDLIMRKNISILYVTPTQLRLLCGRGRIIPLPAVRLILCGGGHLDVQTRRAAQLLCPNAALHLFYGAAETSFITLSDIDTPVGSVGRAYPGVTLRVRDQDGRPTEGIGEVWVSSPYLFDHYCTGNSADTKWQDGFVTLGELGQIDPDGNLWLNGRKARMVTIADQNVFPEAIEVFIATLPQAGPCAVIPMPDALRGNRLVAVVQGADNPEIAARIKSECRTKLGAFGAPFTVLFHPSLPLLASGKVDMVALTQWVEAHV